MILLLLRQLSTHRTFFREFVATEYVNLVYDNIDFGEEIDKQTHVTNGIITQKASVQKQLDLSDHPILIRKTQRTVEMPSTDIVPYHMGAKVTPAFHSDELDPECLELLLKEDPSIRAYKLDLAYILVKYICSPNEEVLPGWTGFNTMLCKNAQTQKEIFFFDWCRTTKSLYPGINYHELLGCRCFSMLARLPRIYG